MAKLGVSILTEQGKDLAKTVNKIIDNGCDWIHYDIMDGRFVPNTSFTLDEVKSCVENTNKHFVDIHLMVNDPEYYINQYHIFADQITFHHETMNYDDTKKLINNIRGFGYRKIKIGIAINPKTNIEQIYEYLPIIDYILVMSVQPGKGGQKFIPETMNKIRKISKYIANRKLKTVIGVDGGVSIDNAKSLSYVGANVLISGSYITKNIRRNIKKFSKEIKN